MTAEVRIFAERRDDALQVPLQAIHDHKGRLFCLVEERGRVGNAGSHDWLEQREVCDH